MRATLQEIETAFAAGWKSFESWADLTNKQRAELARNYASILEKKKEELAALISEETGKPLWESRQEIDTMIRKVDLSIQAQQSRTGETLQTIGNNISRVTHSPHGVLVVLGPFNFPGHLPNGHIVPALLAGNCVIFKPSEVTPATGAWMVEHWREAGLPDGVLSLVQGGRTTAELLLEHPKISGVLFTGSSAAGLAIHRRFAGRPEVILALEMGGNNPMILLDPKNNAFTQTIVTSSFITSGQRCTCTRRLIVVGEGSLEFLVKATQAVTVGKPDQDVFMGRVIHQRAAETILTTQENLIQKGAIVLEKCCPTELGLPFLRPGILDVTGIQEISDEEVFGPLLQVIRCQTFDEAIEIANRTRFGLAAGLLGGTEQQFETFRKRVRAGIINWNQPTTGASSTAPFGGIGQSGNHRPSAYYAADYCAYPVASIYPSA
jgi:succinylglutamic semialdehyde dehydrogenase